ncbi:hypothetical protein B0T24DRAFT_700027 [Lasiosphaeria ovina]|uniref:ferric-chelate reductase (NADPH) n=1 Tax=Lasiosphaeria ovina TaxID=92902 RepID=A0AAE0KI90_9PEZI|nr:hypothetical protein B0T24DRAFT_700027 [Lasiosphaeria ovina]
MVADDDDGGSPSPPPPSPFHAADHRLVAAAFWVPARRGHGRGFGLPRAGWVALAQVPLVLVLASRPNVAAFATGVSDCRVNWVYRCVARTVCLWPAAYGILFVAEWVATDFFWTELRIMSRVKYGFTAGGSLGLDGLELSPPAFVSFLYCRLPRGHRFYAYCALATSAGGSATSWLQFAYRNLHLGRPPCCNGRHTYSLGYEANVVAVGHGLSVLEVNGVHFDWAPGQYASIWAPLFWWQSAHPFTIASSPSPGPGAAGSCRRIVLMMRTKGSFTESMNRHHELRFETVVCKSASTGASFTFPIVQSLAPLGFEAPPTVRRPHILMLACERAELDFYTRRLRQLMQGFAAFGIVVDVTVVVTGGARLEHAAASPDPMMRTVTWTDTSRCSLKPMHRTTANTRLRKSTNPGGLLRSSAESDTRSLLTQSIGSSSDEEQDMAILDPHRNGGKDESSAGYFFHIKGRPDLDQYLDHIMDSTCGRLGISVCGGSAVVAGVREALKAVCCRRKGDG